MSGETDPSMHGSDPSATTAPPAISPESVLSLVQVSPTQDPPPFVNQEEKLENSATIIASRYRGASARWRVACGLTPTPTPMHVQLHVHIRHAGMRMHVDTSPHSRIRKHPHDGHDSTLQAS